MLKVQGVVSEILQSVYENGDAALLDYTEKFDGVRPSNLLLSQDEIDFLASKVPQDVIDSLKRAYERIYRYHSAQKREGFVIENENEVLIQRFIPLKRVGLYVTGGTAPYPLTVLMDAVPAIIAGVGELVMVSPPTWRETSAPLLPQLLKSAG